MTDILAMDVWVAGDGFLAFIHRKNVYWDKQRALESESKYYIMEEYILTNTFKFRA